MTGSTVRSEQSENPTRGGEIRVLLVDDDEAWVESTAKILSHQRESLTVTTATDLETASERVEDVDPDCIVSDYQLERGTGLDLLSEVRAESSDRPFILITGQGNERVASTAIGRQVSDYIPKRSLGGRDDLLARRIETVVESHRTRRALERERRSKDAMLDVLTATTGETELCEGFCTRLVEERGYGCAWVGRETDPGMPVPVAAAGEARYLDAVLGPRQVPPPEEPTRRALESDGFVSATVESADGTTAAGTAEESGGGPTEGGEDGERSWDRVAADSGFERALAVPVGHEGVRLGVLGVYAVDGSMRGERERTALAEFADTLGYALTAAERRRSLLSSDSVSVSVDLGDSDVPLVRLTETLDARFEVHSAIPRDDGTTLYVADVEGVSVGTLVDRAGDVDSVESADFDTTVSPVRCELVVASRTPEEVLAEHGARFERTVVESGTATVSVTIPDDGALATVREAVGVEFDDASVSTVWTGQSDSRPRTVDEALADLTDRQLEVLRHAFDVGYFERPRGASATELADHFGLARATLTQHLRAAQRKLLGSMFD